MVSERRVIAFFSPEIAPHTKFPNGTGGLGEFTTGFGVSAKKLGAELDVDLVIVTLLYSEGQYGQIIRDGRMEFEYIDRYGGGLPDYPYQELRILEDTGVMFTTQINRKLNWIKALRLSDEYQERWNTVPHYFLTTDIRPPSEPSNDWQARVNTASPYGGTRERGSNMERMVAQAWILGCGVEALRRLGIQVSLYHLNETHTAFAAYKLCEDEYRECDDLEEAIRKTRSRVAVTIHTPVDAGNWKFPLKTVEEMTGGDLRILQRVGGNGNGMFNMGASAIRLSRKTNAVSKQHLGVAEEMWAWLGDDLPSLISITNGQSQDRWQYPEFRNARTPGDLREAKEFYNMRLVQYVNGVFGREQLRPGVETDIWARRFAAYKRPTLVFAGDNYEWTVSQLKAGKLQLIFAGKPHPDDNDSMVGMVKVWNEIYRMCCELPGLAILPNYDMGMSKILKGGAHFWLNTPRNPEEACGTSGMGAAFNGAVSISTFSGWMAEADPKNFYGFGTKVRLPDQDAFDAQEFLVARKNASDRFIHDPDGHWEMAYRAKCYVEEYRTSDRMFREYAENLYVE